MSWIERYKSKIVTPRVALERSIKAGDRLMLNANCGEPQTLAEGLAQMAHELRDVEVVQLLALGRSDWVKAELKGCLRLNAMFIGPSVRDEVNAGDADYTPVFLSEIPALFTSGQLRWTSPWCRSRPLTSTASAATA